MPTPVTCVDCGVTLTTQDALADQVVQDDEGFHHRECVDDGPTKPVSAEEVAAAEREGDLTPKQIEEENAARADHGDPPLPDAAGETLVEWKGSSHIAPEDGERQRRFYEQMMGEFPTPEPLDPAEYARLEGLD
jgi:hypothetical protein